MISRNYILSLLFWFALVVAFGFWNYSQEMAFIEELIHNEAMAHLSQDQAFRIWATKHGGVYVPVTDELQPSPYLVHMAERDVITQSGRKLTLINPAWMLRQFLENYEELYGVRGHLTSLNPLRRDNSPVDWEIDALNSFEAGAEEYSTIDSSGEFPVYHFMTPMVVEEGCLQCHDSEEYEVGDIRGGVSVSISSEEYFRSADNMINRQNALLWAFALFGAALISFVFYLQRKKNAELEISRLEQTRLQEALVRKDKLDSIGKLASGMAHEINNPLAGIILSSGVLHDRFGTRIDSLANRTAAENAGIEMEGLKKFMSLRGIDKLIRIIYEDGRKISSLVQDLVVFSEMNRDENECYSIEMLIDMIIRLIKERDSREGLEKPEDIQFVKKIETDVNMEFCGRFLQALFNIALNSAQALDRISRQDKEIIFGVTRNSENGDLLIAVEDNGPGISGETRKQIFDPFYTNKEIGSGKGLGLSVSYYIITGIYHGDIIVDSAVGEGCKMTISIPGLPVPDGNSQQSP